MRTLSLNICRDVLWSPQAVRQSVCKYLPRCLGKFALPTYFAQFLKDVQFACGECLLAVHANLGEVLARLCRQIILAVFAIVVRLRPPPLPTGAVQGCMWRVSCDTRAHGRRNDFCWLFRMDDMMVSQCLLLMPLRRVRLRHASLLVPDSPS